MKKTTHYKGHRWTTDELRALMQMWADGESLDAIATSLNSTRHALLSQIQRMRKAGIPLERRDKGNFAASSHKPWSQGDAEYLLRSRLERKTNEEIGLELGRTLTAVDGMIARLRREQVPVAMRGSGVRRLWNAESLKALSIRSEDSKIVEMDAGKAA